MEKVNSTLILNTLKTMVESKKMIPKEEWLNVAFKLNLLRIDEAQLLNRMKQVVAQKKVELVKAQDKKNISAAELEASATDVYRLMRDQEDLIYSIEQFVMIAKKNSENF